MKIYRYMIGIRFNRPLFCVKSLDGLLAQKILDLVNKEKTFEKGFFTKVSFGETKPAVVLADDDDINRLTITYNDMVFRKTSKDSKSINIDNCIEEFILFWSCLSDVIDMNSIRRIGHVVEYRIPEPSLNSAADTLRDSFLDFEGMNHSRSFHLKFEDRVIPTDIENHNVESDPFTNCIYSIYLSESDDQTPEKGYMCLSLDFQTYYYPVVKPRRIRAVLKATRKELKEKKAIFSRRIEKTRLLQND